MARQAILSGNRDLFGRFILPGFVFKAAIIGGGYATGREMATFFLPSGPLGGLFAIGTALVVWSTVCALTFLFAYVTQARDYRTFSRRLLGPCWWIFDAAFFLAMILFLAAFVAAAGSVGTALFDWGVLGGSLLLMGCIMLVTAFGNTMVENVFRYTSIFLYATYIVFFILAISTFGSSRIVDSLSANVPTTNWFVGGLTFAGYNIIGVILVLPVTRHFRSRRDAVVAGVLAGPMAMIPGLLFFLCMTVFYAEIGNEVLPSDFLLLQLDQPIFRLVFQFMIFVALFESGVSVVNSFNERVSHAWSEYRGTEFRPGIRLAVTALVLAVSLFIAYRIGFVGLVADGYRWVAYIFLYIFVLPLLTYGVWFLSRSGRSAGRVGRTD
ncbi:YkvI family membrane protein [Kineobactrum salinum]|uniref:GerAB/ArcD/ProY family transporter n=1 Tax=Kineobactrum salinum TaxID=2708301 RepID=A0A6C0U0U7_9GAMM|nr:hypothetical protein [Kineobactrum salinum]QIB64597.1 hypothetical protein G3T16_03480 [Kineobactrum salinum]